MNSQPLSEDKTAEEIFEHHFEKMRHGLFRSSLDHYIETGKLSGSMLLEVRAMFKSYASQFKSKDNVPSLSEDRFALKQKFLNDVLGGMSVHDLFEKYLNIPEPDSQWISVKDRMPKRGVNVMVFDFGHISIGARPALFEIKSMKEIYERNFPEHTFDSGDWTGPSTSVTHWMPLPSPPGKPS